MALKRLLHIVPSEQLSMISPAESSSVGKVHMTAGVYISCTPIFFKPVYIDFSHCEDQVKHSCKVGTDGRMFSAGCPLSMQAAQQAARDTSALSRLHE